MNHTNYHSFIWQKEENFVKFRAKQLPQDKEFVPRAGIRLLKEDTMFLEVEPAEFRTHEIPFDRIFKSVSIITSKVPQSERIVIQSSWDRLRDSLEAFPRRITTLKKMNLNLLPKQSMVVLPSISSTLTVFEQEGSTISGDLYDERIEDGSLEEIEEDVDVCIYSDVAAGRPWVGRVKQMLPGGKCVIQWFNRRSGRGQIFKAMVKEDISDWSMTNYSTNLCDCCFQRC